MKRIWGVLVLCIVLSLCAAPVWGQSFGEAIEASKRGDYEAAVSGFEALAEKDHASALFSLGFIHYEGLVVPKTTRKLSSGFARRQRKATHARNPASDSCSTKAKAYLKTTRKPSSGFGWQRRRTTLPRNSFLESCTTKARGYPKTTRKLSSGFANGGERPRRRASQPRKHALQRLGRTQKLRRGIQVVEPSRCLRAGR